MRKNFFVSFFSLVRLSYDIRDKFLRMKLISKINNFFDLFLTLQNSGKEGESDVAQCKRDFLNSAEELFEFLDLLSYLKSASASPILKTQKALLSLKSVVLDFDLLFRVRESAVGNPEKQTKQKEKIVKTQNNSGGRINKSLVADFIQSNQGLTSKEIFNFLKNKISKRTFQRYLAELSKSGDITKKLENGSPKYYTTVGRSTSNS